MGARLAAIGLRMRPPYGIKKKKAYEAGESTLRRKRKPLFANVSVKVTLGFLFAIVAIIPMLSIGYISMHTFSNTVLERSVQQSLSRLELVEYRTIDKVREKHRSTLLAAFDENMRAYFEADASRLPGSRSIVENETRKQLIGLFNSQEDAAVKLVSLDGTRTVMKDVTHSGVRAFASQEELTSLSQFRLFDHWGAPTRIGGEAVLPYERIVLDLENRPAAMLIVYVKETLLYNLYSGYLGPETGAFYIVNGAGQIVSASDRDAFGGDIAAIGLTTGALSQESGYLRAGDDTYAYRANPQRGLYFIEQIPPSVITSGTREILKSMLYVMLVSLAACVLLGSLMARSFTQPLYRLIGRIQPHDPSGAEPISSRNEIAILSDRYDRIVDRLNTLIAEYYEEQRKKKEAEIRALEFQINPHFLYNTLSTIVWLIEANEGKEAIRITKELAAFFRISVSKGSESIRIAEEVRHVMLYTDIQSARYEGIDFAAQVPGELLDYYTPKLILQPLVENAIIHALQKSEEKRCRIRVRAFEDADDIVFEVSDDGASATEETIAGMNEFLRSRRETGDRRYGIGISNVHDRVAMRFGEGYGLSYRRENGLTVASVRIRKQKGAETDV